MLLINKFMTEKKSELHLAFSTPIWTSIIPNYRDVNDKTKYETKTVCYKCKIDMKLLPCDEEENTINGISQ